MATVKFRISPPRLLFSQERAQLHSCHQVAVFILRQKAMKHPKNLSGIKYGNLLVIKKSYTKKVNNKTRSFWQCLCDCGNIVDIQRDCLIGGGTKSCGCLKLKGYILPQRQKIEKMKKLVLSKISKNEKTGCWNWNGIINTYGYGQQPVYNLFGFKKRNMNASRLSAALFKNFDPNNNMCVLHSCDNPACINPDHLFFGTQTENMQDMRNKNRRAIGEKHGMSKLSESDVKNILVLLEQGALYKQIAKKYHVVASTINNIRLKKSWKHLSRNIPAQD